VGIATTASAFALLAPALVDDVVVRSGELMGSFDGSEGWLVKVVVVSE
jgi:hypothetical protein